MNIKRFLPRTSQRLKSVDFETKTKSQVLSLLASEINFQTLDNFFIWNSLSHSLKWQAPYSAVKILLVTKYGERRWCQSNGQPNRHRPTPPLVFVTIHLIHSWLLYWIYGALISGKKALHSRGTPRTIVPKNGLVSLFNVISTSVGYLMPEPSL